jgi:hypothetical protein
VLRQGRSWKSNWPVERSRWLVWKRMPRRGELLRMGLLLSLRRSGSMPNEPQSRAKELCDLLHTSHLLLSTSEPRKRAQ